MWLSHQVGVRSRQQVSASGIFYPLLLSARTASSLYYDFENQSMISIYTTTTGTRAPLSLASYTFENETSSSELLIFTPFPLLLRNRSTEFFRPYPSLEVFRVHAFVKSKVLCIYLLIHQSLSSRSSFVTKSRHLINRADG